MGWWSIIALLLFYPEMSIAWIPSNPGPQSEPRGVQIQPGIVCPATKVDSEALDVVAGVHQGHLQI